MTEGSTPKFLGVIGAIEVGNPVKLSPFPNGRLFSEQNLVRWHNKWIGGTPPIRIDSHFAGSAKDSRVRSHLG